MSTEELDNMNPEAATPRPTFLKVLCILSFISIGLSLVVSLGSLAYGPQSAEQMEDSSAMMMEATDDMRSKGMTGMADLFDQIQRMSVSMNENFYQSTLMTLVVLGIGLYGVLIMWKGRKLGFHLYIIYSLVSIGQLYLFVRPADIPSFIIIWNVIISGIFIIMYSRNLHWLK